MAGPLRQAETTARVLSSDRLDIHTGIPGTVRSYDPGTQTAEIRLDLREVREAADEDDPDQVSDYPILSGVPVAFPSAGGFSLTFKIPAGTTGLVTFAEGDLSKWLETGDVSDPAVGLRHGLSGGIFWPGVRHSRNRLANAAAEGIRLGKDGGPALTIDTSIAFNAAIEVNGSSDAAALASKADAEYTAIKATLDSFNGTTFTVPYTPTPGGVASSNLKTGG